MTRAVAKFLILCAVVLAVVGALAGEWLIVVVLALVALGQAAVIRRRV